MNIVFAHNVYNRFITLRNTILIEKKYFPDSNVSVAYNGDFINIFYKINDICFKKFNEKTHKIGCVNGCIISIQNLLDKDFDVLIFSHDDVYINESNVAIVKENIDDIVNNKYDIICRKPDNKELGHKYYMMEVFFISKKAVIDIFNNANKFSDENKIPRDNRGSISPEVWLFEQFNNKNYKIDERIFYNVTDDDYNTQLGKQMGYYHKNIGIRGWTD